MDYRFQSRPAGFFRFYTQEYLEGRLKGLKDWFQSRPAGFFRFYRHLELVRGLPSIRVSIPSSGIFSFLRDFAYRLYDIALAAIVSIPSSGIFSFLLGAARRPRIVGRVP